MFSLFKKKDIVDHPYREPQQPVKSSVDPRLQTALLKGQSEFESKQEADKRKLREVFEVDGGWFFQQVQKAVGRGKRELDIAHDTLPAVLGMSDKERCELAGSYVKAINGLSCKMGSYSNDRGGRIYYLSVKW